MSLLLLFGGGDTAPSGGFQSLVLIELGGISGPETVVEGTLARTLSNDTLAASGSAGYGGGFRSLALLEIGGIGLTASGGLAVTLSGDTLAALGTTTILSTLAKTLANDTLSAAGFAGSIAGGFRSLAVIELGGISYSDQLTGTLSVTLGDDTIVAVGEVPVVVTGIGSRRPRVGRGPYSLGNYFRRNRDAFTSVTPGRLEYTLTGDTLVASGFATTITGTLAKTLLNDTLATSGGSSVSGTLEASLQNDTLVVVGTTTVLGTTAVTLNNDTLTGYVVVGNVGDSTSRLPLTGVGT